MGFSEDSSPSVPHYFVLNGSHCEGSFYEHIFLGKGAEDPLWACAGAEFFRKKASVGGFAPEGGTVNNPRITISDGDFQLPYAGCRDGFISQELAKDGRNGFIVIVSKYMAGGGYLVITVPDVGGWNRDGNVTKALESMLNAEISHAFALQRGGITLPGLTVWGLCRKQR